jgi:uroporphyrinogen decarboxylase
VADPPFLRACRREPVPFTPIWLMRQAGRYQPEYRAIRERVSFLELCKNPELAAEVTVMAVDSLGVDAAIIFADILLIVEPLGVGLEFSKDDGPLIRRPVRTAEDVSKLPEELDVEESVGFVMEAIRRARRELDSRTPRVPLIGFSGAPFTLSSYLADGHGTRSYLHTKRLMYRDPAAWHALMGRLSDAVAGYLNAQIAAGAEAVQLFDSWVGCLSREDYRVFVQPYTRRTIAAIKPGIPVIHFGTGTATLLDLMRDAGGDVIGLDWRVDLGQAWQQLGHGVGVQGNLDPVLLLAAEPNEIRRRAARILEGAADRPGHIFNLGHGVLVDTPVDNVRRLVDAVHELSAR